jgi:hypothetical protein
MHEADIEQLTIPNLTMHLTFHKHDSARDLRLRGSCSGRCPALDLKHQHTHPNMDAEAQKAKFAIHQACREGQSTSIHNIIHRTDKLTKPSSERRRIPLERRPEARLTPR